MEMSSDITVISPKEKYEIKIVKLSPIVDYESKYILKCTCCSG